MDEKLGKWNGLSGAPYLLMLCKIIHLSIFLHIGHHRPYFLIRIILKGDSVELNWILICPSLELNLLYILPLGIVIVLSITIV